MRTTIRTVQLGVLALMATACNGQPPAVPSGSGLFGEPPAGRGVTAPPRAVPDTSPDQTLFLGRDIELVGGWMEGSMGPVHDFSGEIVEFGGGGDTLAAFAGDDDWGAMVMLTLEGALDETLSVRRAIGCAGPELYSARFDEPAVQSEVAYTPAAVEGEPGVLDVVVTFADGTTTNAALHVETLR